MSFAMRPDNLPPEEFEQIRNDKYPEGPDVIETPTYIRILCPDKDEHVMLTQAEHNYFFDISGNELCTDQSCKARKSHGRICLIVPKCECGLSHKIQVGKW